MLCALLMGSLTGCTTYEAQPEPRPAYLPETPRPREVYVPPPVEYVERPVQYLERPAVVVEDAYVGIRTEDDFYEP